ncbi:DUF1837 domain-containing protein [Elizabethkingia anophelis]|uniref:Hachiman antiphage defense system protein HamA n=1 Tax=Elizabethkingia anophelis TaxID=1117645 RepID=UPI0009994B8F|nr:Hachiman antiphage defense system protein HamA [Elizabethkingia anophelis]MCT3699007.1 DUF1837 domain-containing protein [Elizabethkingia anophelis]MCT4264839.1 DUF1837 domain-containing protein [Elizabethkingia anophelis]MCT4268840.1 DUF1837 domain-containing protein [Elizabethkingia anophelis]MDV3931840.1 DUF1837 domain-containing protein [Elizabethkingia anophelis]MYY29616.1 DUF1837 domain-containing protein [Elizabethkingia anophelis]
MGIDWKKKIKIDNEWVSRQLINHFSNKKLKITVRGYTPKSMGTKFSCDSLIEELGFMLPDYVHTEADKEKTLKQLISKYDEETGRKRLDVALLKDAQTFFGKKDPSTDGKYGELLLFALTESILKSKMVAHKIKGLSNPKDQVKGGDGIFLGNYEINNGEFTQAILIGESKIMKGFSDCIDDAYDSLNRFHDPITQSEFNAVEYLVASNTMFIDKSDLDYDEVYDLLTPGTNAFKKQIMVHPILIMYNTAKIDTIERNAKDNSDFELMMKDFMEKEKSEFIKKIEDKMKAFPNIEKVYVDFFIFPFNNIDFFRNGMYYNIHKVPFSK